MIAQLQLIPDQASGMAGRVDALFLFLSAVTGAVALLVCVLIISFAIRYRRRREDHVTPRIIGSLRLELAWSIIPLFFFCVMFAWGARIYLAQAQPPLDALNVYVVGKQWMWKLQHPEGEREINELHVPVGRDVRLTMTSQDVIHSFFVPAFRIKQDVVPGRYSSVWFRATKPGRYHLFCAEYCGTKHSGMIGWVYAMESADYSRWISAGGAEGSLSSMGEKLYHQYGCSTCHDLQGKGPGPSFIGVYGSTVRLDDGSTVVADDAYIRESILQSQAKVVLGFKGIMPVFQGQLDEDQVRALIEFVKALGVKPAEKPHNPAPSPGAPTGISESTVDQR